MSKKLTVVLTRHGAVNNPEGVLYFRNVDVELSPEGHSQMEQLGELLKGRNINPAAIFTSTHTRAIESAREIAKSFPGAPIIENRDLQDADAPTVIGKTSSWVTIKRLIGKDVFSDFGK